MSNIVRHHLLEIILWPNNDGSMLEIRNSRKYLKELGIYDEHMTIEMTREEHASLHHKGQPRTDEHKYKISESLKGRSLSEETKLKISRILTGRTQSMETKLKRSNKLKGRHWRIVNGKHEWYD